MLNIYPIITVNEGSTPRIEGTVTDETGALVPDADVVSATLAVHDYNAGTQLRAPGAITITGGSFSAWLTRAETRILTAALEYEHRVITVDVQLSGNRYASGEAYVKVVNLRHVTVPAPA